MKSTTKLILPIALIAVAGLTHAGEPSEGQAPEKTHEMMSHMDSEMPMKGEMPMEKGMPMADGTTHDDAAPSDPEASKSKHNHREFKGLPSDPTPGSEDAAGEDDEKAEGHDHRKKHK